MKFYDFEFDGLQLSEMGFVVCSFDGHSSVDATMGSQLEFNTILQKNGEVENLINANYKDHLESTFQVCKKSCTGDIEAITIEEIRDMYSWLNRKKFHKFKPLNDEYMELYFEGSFNIGCIEINGKTYGLELTFISNRPFALEENKVIYINADAGNEYVIYDTSDEEGYIYPNEIEITLKDSGDLEIINTIENRHTVISNCVKGEIITMNYPVIASSETTHQIQNDFNWNFIRIANTFKNKKNVLTFSLPCEVKLIYHPIAKIVI